MSKSLDLRAPAKVNLFLEVLAKRPDGYHDLESVFQAVSLYDEITLTLADEPGVRLRCDVAALETPDNLAAAAAREFLSAAPFPGGVDIDLRKKIPLQGGLGGGSSDAAAVLVGLNDMVGKPLAPHDLRRLAASIGSDVPFFLDGGTALVTGRGEKVVPLESPGSYHYLIFYPGFGVSTASVYKNLSLKLTEKRKSAKVLCALLALGNLEAAGEHFFNRLEQAAYGLEKRLVEARAAVQRAVGDTRVNLCGSGASLFSAFVDHDRAYRAYRALKGTGVGEVFLAENIPGRRSTASAKGDSRGDFRS